MRTRRIRLAAALRSVARVAKITIYNAVIVEKDGRRRWASKRRCTT